MKTTQTILSALTATLLSSASAQINITITQGEEGDLAAGYDATDLIQGLIAVELPGDKGWHPANTDPLDKLPAFTDGQGVRPTGLTGLLADFPGAGAPAKLIEYTLPLPADISEVRVFTGNNDRDGRVFHTYTVRFSSDGGQTFGAPIYVQSHPSGTINTPVQHNWRVALSQVTDLAGPLATGVTHLQFNFYAVHNTQNQMRDPYDGLNPFTGTDDGLNAPIASPLVWEIDVLGTDSPPRLAATLLGNDLQLTWLARDTNVVLEAATQLAPPDWAEVNPQPEIQQAGITNRMSLVATNAAQYFRLRRGL